jgi:hypothetical protein
MNKPKVKEQFIGATTQLKNIGKVTIRQDHAAILLREGHFDKLEGVQRVDMLKAVKPEEEKAIEDKTIHELRKLAKGLDGFSLSLKKIELIELINDSTK